MNKYYLIKKQTGEVKSISDGVIEFDKDIFEQRQITTSPAVDDLIRQGYKMKYTNKLELEKPPQIKEKEDKENLKTQIDNAENLNEVKEIIKNLL